MKKFPSAALLAAIAISLAFLNLKSLADNDLNVSEVGYKTTVRVHRNKPKADKTAPKLPYAEIWTCYKEVLRPSTETSIWYKSVGDETRWRIVYEEPEYDDNGMLSGWHYVRRNVLHTITNEPPKKIRKPKGGNASVRRVM